MTLFGRYKLSQGNADYLAKIRLQIRPEFCQTNIPTLIFKDRLMVKVMVLIWNPLFLWFKLQYLLRNLMVSSCVSMVFYHFVSFLKYIIQANGKNFL